MAEHAKQKESSGEQKNGIETRAAKRRAQTRKNILEAARQVFAEQGFEAANVSDIVKQVGVAQGTFYYHFPDKKSILIEMLTDFFDQAKSLAAAWAATTDTGAEAAQQFSGNAAMLLYANRELARIIMKEAHNPDPEISGLISEAYEFLYDQTEKGLELGMELGVVRPLDARITAVAFIGMIKEVVFELLESNQDIDLAHVINEISKLQNYGIRPHYAGGA